MIYRVKEKFWSLGNNFTITDEAGLNCYRVTGKAFSWGDKLSFQDMEGKELAFIKQKIRLILDTRQHTDALKNDEEILKCLKEYTANNVMII